MTRREAVGYLRPIMESASLPNYQAALRLAVEALEDKGGDAGLDDLPVLGKICRMALDTWGPVDQTVVANEELAELQQALCKSLRGCDNKDNIAEEIADVRIMLAQMTMLHDCAELVRSWQNKKLVRLLGRLREAHDAMYRSADQTYLERKTKDCEVLK